MATKLTAEQQAKILKLKVSELATEIKNIYIDAKTAEGNPAEFPKFRGKYKGLENVYDNFVKAWDKLYEVFVVADKEGEFPFEQSLKQTAKSQLYECHSIYETIMNPVPVRANASHRLSNTGGNILDMSLSRSRLSKIKIPPFHGDILKWGQFRDIFVSMVQDDNALTDIEKFHYLVGSLTGEPLQIVTSFPLTAANFEPAWAALLKRFNNKRILAAAYMKQIRQFKHTNPSPHSLTYLRSYLQVVDESFASMRTLRIPDEANFLKLDIALEHLDAETRKLYEEKQQGQEFPTYESLIEFIQQRCQILELAAPQTARSTHSKATDLNANRSKVLAIVDQKDESSSKNDKRSRFSISRCLHCDGNHPLYKCYSFKRLPVADRIGFIQERQVCGNCLKAGHKLPECPSRFSCIYCNQRHHSIMHQSNAEPAASSVGPQPNEPSSSQVAMDVPPAGVIGAATESRNVILGTAVVHMINWKGDQLPIRIVIDSGSQFSIMTADCAKRLGLNWSPIQRSLSGIGCTQPPPAKGIVVCRLRPIQADGQELETQALVMHTITPALPTVSLDPSICTEFDSINLADTRFWESRPIDFLLGSDLFLQILSPEPQIKVTDNFGTLPTIFGHVVIGSLPEPHPSAEGTCLSATLPPLSDDILKDFWRIEEPLPSGYCHPEDAYCESHFTENVSRMPSGRYVVALPLRQPQRTFPESKHLALKRFLKLESKLARDTQLREKYDDFMKEYSSLRHMEETSRDSAYVIPHHAVFKKELGSATPPKLRVVFDASMRAGGSSLNENLLVGPKLQLDITTIILNFRVHKIAFCTDIIKMFRQILVRPEDRCFQHILWRFSPEERIRTFELNTITYGLASSPYLALRVLRHLAEADGPKFPDAANALLRDVYVDDVITGSDSLESALQLRDQIINLLKEGEFEVHKWASNSEDFLKTIPEEVRANVGLLPKESTTKVLGMFWDAESDLFFYQVELTESNITKRSILSVIARLFDPLGLLAPIVFLAKTILQQLWLLNLDWDDQPPDSIKKSWEDFLQELPEVNKIKIPRWIRINTGQPTLFGFCDASQQGYAAALYLRLVEADGSIHTFLIKSKTRLAPVKTISVPRLELCAAHLLIKLLRSIDDFCQTHLPLEARLFSDSTIVLSWLRINPTALKTFVANRVGYILSHSNIDQWHHVPSEENPADIASRGMPTNSLIANELWWRGPVWMSIEPLALPAMPQVLTDVPEKKEICTVTVSSGTNASIFDQILSKASTYRRAVATLAYCLRFIKDIRRQTDKHNISLSVEELDRASVCLIKNTQRQFFSKDFDFEAQVCLSTRFRSLAIFSDQTGVLRVGGRLTRAPLPYERKHPVVLPPGATFTALLVDYIHCKNFHLGLAALQAHVQRQYYIFRLRSVLRQRIWKCMRCFKSKATTKSPFMADLPLSRVSQGRPFIRVGVDFAGPFVIKLSTRRNSSTTKAYLCLFVCMAIKAVHLELVSALTTEAFLAAFHRFIARRGMPTDVYSDCGPNFVGAARRLKELYQWYTQHSTEEDINQYAADLGITWHFNPPYSPHFGGLWEAAVKCAKSHLKKSLGDRPFYFEELSTIFARIEAVMNSRPLCRPTPQPDNYDYLTPGHFLIGSALLAPPEKDYTDLNLSHQSRWQLIQSSVQTFWKRWATEYVHLLQSRPKWTKHLPNLKPDDLVLLQDPQAPPLKWRMGRIVELHPGQDGTARVATVKTAAGLVKRAIHKLAVLPLDDTQ